MDSFTRYMYAYFIIDIHSPTSHHTTLYERIYLRMRKQDGGDSEMVGIYMYIYIEIIQFCIYDRKRKKNEEK